MQVEELLAFARIRPVVNQVELHPLCAQRKLVGVCLRKGVQCVGYSPMGGQVGCGDSFQTLKARLKVLKQRIRLVYGGDAWVCVLHKHDL